MLFSTIRSATYGPLRYNAWFMYFPLLFDPPGTSTVLARSCTGHTIVLFPLDFVWRLRLSESIFAQYTCLNPVYLPYLQSQWNRRDLRVFIRCLK